MAGQCYCNEGNLDAAVMHVLGGDTRCSHKSQIIQQDAAPSCISEPEIVDVVVNPSKDTITRASCSHAGEELPRRTT